MQVLNSFGRVKHKTGDLIRASKSTDLFGVFFSVVFQETLCVCNGNVWIKECAIQCTAARLSR